MILRSRALALTLAAGVLAGSLVNLLSVKAGGRELSLPALSLLAFLVVASLALYWGRQVAQYSRVETRSKAANMTPLFAARVAVFAQAMALTGSLVAGWQLAILGYQLGVLDARATWLPLVDTLCALAGGVILLVCGIVVENWCKIPPDDDELSGGISEVAPQPGPLGRTSDGS